MKKVFNTLSIALIVTVTLFTSCKKGTDTPVSTAESMLTAKTWQVDEVKAYTASGTFTEYKKGASNNASDFSKVRQKYNADGSITYTDDSGMSGNDGKWELLDNKTKLKVSLPSINVSVICQGFSVTANTFSYKLYFSATEYTQFNFIPVP